MSSASYFEGFFVKKLVGGFKYFLCSPLFGEDEPILTSIFFKGVGSTTKKKKSTPTFLHFGGLL